MPTGPLLLFNSVMDFRNTLPFAKTNQLELKELVADCRGAEAHWHRQPLTFKVLSLSMTTDLISTLGALLVPGLTYLYEANVADTPSDVSLLGTFPFYNHTC